MRIRHFTCPFRTWEVALARPHPRLRQAVHFYRGYRKDLVRPRRWLGFPATVVTLVLGFDTGHLSLRRPDEPAGRTGFMSSLVTGLTTRSWVCEDSGNGHGVEVVIAPWAAFTVFGIEMQGIADGVAGPGEVLGGRAEELTGALAALPDWEQRFDLLDTVLSLWIGDGLAWSQRVAWVYEELRRSHGTLPIGKLVEDAGWSRRQLEQRFREQIGLPPKTVARVFRFRQAVRLLTDGWATARTAEACGFSDQAHLTREFKAFTGITPSRFRTRARSTADALAAVIQARDARTIALAT